MGDTILAIPWVPVASLEQDVSATSYEIRLNQPLLGDYGGKYKYDRGVFLLEDEILGYEWAKENNKVLSMPPGFDGSTGLFRGLFGTTPASHSATSSLAYGIPWRFWDGYKPTEFDNRMPYHQVSIRMEDAFWRTVSWTTELPPGDTNVSIMAIVRMDGRGEYWDTGGPSDASLVWASTKGQESLTLNRRGTRNDAGQLDMRFYVDYAQGSFDAQQSWMTHSWKRTPKLKEVRVSYERPTRTLYHEDR